MSTLSSSATSKGLDSFKIKGYPLLSSVPELDQELPSNSFTLRTISKDILVRHGNSYIFILVVYEYLNDLSPTTVRINLKENVYSNSISNIRLDFTVKKLYIKDGVQ